MKKILLIGKNGQLGQSLSSLLGKNCVATGKEELDLGEDHFTKRLDDYVRHETFSAVINAAAYTHVDQAETDGWTNAQRINNHAVGELAIWCQKNTLPLVHFSTDYVFNGRGDTPWREEDHPEPVNAYGKSKRSGEIAIATQSAQYLIFRVSWLYDIRGHNFCNRLITLFHEKETVPVVSDQTGAPTYVPHLAQAILSALQNASKMADFPSGIYHVSSLGKTSRCDFAKTLLASAMDHDSSIICRKIEPVLTSAYPLPAVRPLNSRLDCTRVKKILHVIMPSWQAGLRHYIKKKYASQ